MHAYRILLSLLSPFLALAFALRLIRGRETWRDLRTRLCRDLPRQHRDTARPPVLWIHGASNGELTAAKSLIETIRAKAPDLPIVITVNTASARHMVRDWQMPDVEVRLAPLDLRRCITGFLDHYRPSCVLSIENEIWPNRFDMIADRDLPLIVISARMSETTARRWQQLSRVFGGVLTRVVGAISFLAAQDAASEQRMIQMGLPPAALLPRMNLKATVKLPDVPAADLAALAPRFEREKTILAASTHEGEEEIITDAFTALQASHPDAKLILAPRHPARGARIAAMLKQRGCAFGQRSAGDAPGAVPIFLADTLGEMALWYQLSGLCFVGGSLVDRGGHTPFEPMQFGCAVLHGPHVTNHTRGYRALGQAAAARSVADAETLTQTFDALLRAPQAAAEMAAHARDVAAQFQDRDQMSAGFWRALARATGHRAFADETGA